MTVFEALLESIRGAASYNRADQTPPAAVLWTDGDRQWEPLLPRLRAELTLLTLGDYDPQSQRGPAIWLRCAIAGTLPEVAWVEGVTPVVYLPGVSRQELRAVEGCARHLQPLAELQYRGVLWTQKSGRDWTIAAFLQSADGGLRIPVAGDSATRDAMRRALLKLADEPVEALRADAPLNATSFHELMDPEPARSVLVWLNDPDGQRQARDPADWATFRAICGERYGFDPETDGPLTAAQSMGLREGAWNLVWQRFAEAPRRYMNLNDLLRRARPKGSGTLFEQRASWPQDNEVEERALREALAALSGKTPAEARQIVRDLEERHGHRREWVWAEQGQSPLAGVMPAMVALADATEVPLGGATPAEIAAAYVAGGWRADGAVIDALAGVERAPDVAAVKEAVDVLYRYWLGTTAETFQHAVQRDLPAMVSSAATASPAPDPGCCLLFADGLRYDIGQRLADALAERGLTVTRGWRFGALPGVTATAKPAASPIAGLLVAGPEFAPALKADGARLTADAFRRELGRGGYAVLESDATGDPDGRGWTEFGSLDAYGHAQGWLLARRVTEEMRALAERIETLLNAGWKEVRVLTDHGWLLLPGGFPKAELAEHLTEARKGRCARLKAAAMTQHPTVPWRWDAQVRIAIAPNIRCFIAGKEYEHGGLSPQECVVPVLTVRPGGPTAPAMRIAEIRWVGLRCRVQVMGGGPGLMLDLRTKAADASTSLAASPRPVGSDGQASIAVPDDTRSGEAALVVVLDATGKVLAQLPTMIGD